MYQLERPVPDALELVMVDKCRKDIIQACSNLSDDDVRWLVGTYYKIQDFRIQAGNQVSAAEKAEHPHEVGVYIHQSMNTIESQVKRALTKYADSKEIGQWATSIVGIGPVIAAGMMAHIDLDKTKGVAKLWRFAGQDPTAEWKRGQRRPWNAALKVIAWKAGESFVLTNKHEDSLYGRLYRERKDLETERNEAGKFAEQAALILKNKNIGKETEAYKAYIEGKLPKGQIHARAKRYAVKIFFAHYYEVAFFLKNGERAPKPYAIDILKHQDYISPPNFSFS